ncbi:MAG: GAF domain-containing protein, partial [Planctomycetes bacterium]|nr:GAF domain-containing protein [Planctomycetota bacterium]
FTGLWGLVLNERKSVLVNSPAEDPRASGTPEGHIPIERFIGVPSLVGDEVIGMLAIANADRDYVGRDLWLVERLAETYALAIQSNRSQRRLEKHQSQLRDLVSSLGLAQERSARKLAAGLRSEIIDRLNSTRQSMASSDKPECKDPMPGVREALGDLVETAHAFASGLSCPVLRQSGLAAAVERWLAEDIRKKHGIETVFEKDDTRSVFDEDMGHFLFEAIKELLTNTVEHAHATRVKVSLKRDGDDVQVAVADDGIGFDTAEIGPKTGEGARYNLFCIGERLRYLGGDMAVDSAPGKGTTVVLKAPAKAQ